MINIKQAFIQYYYSIEAFIYIWYDAYNKMYYLGKHKGTPDDSYTHSSMSSEEFCSIVPHSTTPINERKEFFKNMPKGVTRRILAYGTDEEMCILEHKLLVNRKERCWDRYYNESLGDPRYVDTSGKGNPMWGKTGKNHHFFGKTHTPETKQKMSEAKSDKNNPSYKHGRSVGASKDPKIRAAYAKVKYANMTPEKKEEYLRRCNRYEKERRANETPEQTAERQRKDRDRKREKYAKNKEETGYAIGYSLFKKKTVGTLEAFFG